jgi:DNA-binding NtrC family response regulator
VVETKRILIVEDELTVAQALERALNLPRGGSYAVERCDSAEAALKRLGQEHFDLVISDLRLPGMNGLDLIERAHRLSPGIHCVLITAYGSPQVEARARLLTDAYLPKPFRLADMVHIVGCILDQFPVDLEGR